MNKFNIALLHYSCPPVVGGVEEVVRQQASLFYRYFHKVKIFAGTGGQFTSDYEIEINPLLGSGNEEVHNAHQSLMQGDTKPLAELADRIERYLREALANFDILIAHNVLTMKYNLPLTIALRQLADKNSVHIISWNHDSHYFYPEYEAFLDNSPWNILQEPHPNICYVAISDSRREMFQKLYHGTKSIVVIPNGIDPIRFFRLDPVTVRLIQEQRLFEEDFLMVQPSRLHPRKNIELSVRVVRKLQEKGLRARLLVTGAYDPHEPGTKDYYHKLVKLTEQLNVKEDVLIMAEYQLKSGEQLQIDRIIMRDLYLIADILFIPSIQEGFGIPLLEAGMLKLPVVCSDIPPFREIGGNDVCRFKLEDSPEGIAQKILDFTSGFPTHHFFRRVINQYAWDNIYHKYLLPLIQKILKENRQ